LVARLEKFQLKLRQSVTLMSLLPALRDFFNFPEFSPTNWRDFDTRPVVNIKDLSAGFSPNVDVKATAEHIIIHADLAGIPKDDIHIDL